MKKNILFIFIGLLFSCSSFQKKMVLPFEDSKTNSLQISKLFSNGLVLQRNTAINIWGKALPNAKVKIISQWGQKLFLKTDVNGSWNGQLQTPDAGGPFYMQINSGMDTILIQDILIGEVWLASGQSNMEMTFKGYPPKDVILNSSIEISNANFPNIRMFTVKKNLSVEPVNELNGSWASASPDNVENFSATGYFFAREIHESLAIPVGIINSTWGGSPAEGWTSESKLKQLGFFSDKLELINNSKVEHVIEKWFKKFDSIEVPKQESPMDRMEDQYKRIEFSDSEFSKIDFEDSNWKSTLLPIRYDSLVSTQFDGVMWFRKEIDIEDLSSDYTMNIGYINDMDQTFINGNLVGGIIGFGFWNQKRNYKIPKAFLKKGKNLIAIRAVDIWGPGRISGLMNLSNETGKNISLEGDWKYNAVAELYANKFYLYLGGTSISERPNFIKLNQFLPEVLFNAMINPLIPYSLRGVIWYQGESNVGRHEQYLKLFPGMIEDWRNRWQTEFPFYFVQIAPYRYKRDTASSVSQYLRESQRHTLKLPKTGMAVTLDIGDFNNIHPSNKQDVGKRLARLALVNDYKVELAPMGPILIGNEVVNDSIKLVFDHVARGLVNHGDHINQFEISGSDSQYYEANVLVKKNIIYLTSEFVTKPKYARYAWSDTPKATLFNSEGFPSSSFMIEVK